jgi:hypothetical protein
MFNKEEKQLLANILKDYLNFTDRIVKNDEIVISLVYRLGKGKMNKTVLSRQQMVDKIS